MFPDQKSATPVTPAMPASLPPVQQSAAMQPTLTPITAQSPEQELAAMVDRIKLLSTQYGSNPHAFAAAFQQLKSQYLLDRYHIDANTEKG
jgi:hypothetical protein